MKIKEIFVVATLFLVVTVSITSAKELDKIKIGGMLSIQYVNAGKDVTDRGFFHLGSIDDDPSLEYSYITLGAEVTENISVYYQHNLASYDEDWVYLGTVGDMETGVGERVLISRTLRGAPEEAYIDIKNVRKVKENGEPTVNLKVGIFTVPFGLGVIKEVDDKTDKGVLVYGSYGEEGSIINYEAAIVDGDTGEGTNEKDIYLKGAFLYRDIPCSVSIYRGRVGEHKRRATALAATYVLDEDSKIEGQYITTKYDDRPPFASAEVKYFYLKGERRFREQNTTAYIKYIEANPKNDGVTTSTEYAVEYDYTENTIIKAAYVENDEPKKIDNNLFKIELRIEF